MAMQVTGPVSPDTAGTRTWRAGVLGAEEPHLPRYRRTLDILVNNSAIGTYWADVGVAKRVNIDPRQLGVMVSDGRYCRRKEAKKWQQYLSGKQPQPGTALSLATSSTYPPDAREVYDQAPCVAANGAASIRRVYSVLDLAKLPLDTTSDVVSAAQGARADELRHLTYKTWAPTIDALAPEGGVVAVCCDGDIGPDPQQLGALASLTDKFLPSVEPPLLQKPLLTTGDEMVFIIGGAKESLAEGTPAVPILMQAPSLFALRHLWEPKLSARDRTLVGGIANACLSARTLLSYKLPAGGGPNGDGPSMTVRTALNLLGKDHKNYHHEVFHIRASEHSIDVSNGPAQSVRGNKDVKLPSGKRRLVQSAPDTWTPAKKAISTLMVALTRAAEAVMEHLPPEAHAKSKFKTVLGTDRKSASSTHRPARPV